MKPVFLVLGIILFWSCSSDDSQSIEMTSIDRCVLEGNAVSLITPGEVRTFTTGEEQGLNVTWKITGNIELLKPINSREMDAKFLENFTEGTISVEISGSDFSCVSEIDFAISPTEGSGQ